MIPAAVTPKHESEMIRAILDGSRELFSDLIAPHLTALTAVVHGRMGGNPDAADVVQQTAIKAYIHLEQYRYEASFRAWLIRIGINEARTWRRKCASSRLLAIDPMFLNQFPGTDDRLSPAAEYERHEAAGQLRAAIACLPERYRSIMLLRHIHGCSLSEVAARLALSIPVVKTRQNRAWRQMAMFLKPLIKPQPRKHASQ